MATLKPVIIDTSVWIENDRKGVPELANLLDSGVAVMHWAVYGELAVGQIKNRERFLADLRLLDFCEETTLPETAAFIEKEKLHGKGLSLVDCILMASAKKAGAFIFSLDKKLNTFC
jgi:predicted nucleic acid-binding protein